VQEVLDAGRPFAVSELILAAVIRISTNEKVFDPPASMGSALTFSNALRNHPRAVLVNPGKCHWEIFQQQLETTGITGPDTTDAYLAALAMEHDCEWWTTDQGFERFPSLRRRNPLRA